MQLWHIGLFGGKTGANHKKTDDMISDDRDQTNSGESISEEQSTSTDETSDSAVYTNAISIDSVIQRDFTMIWRF